MQAHPSFRTAALCAALFACWATSAQAQRIAPATPVAAPSSSSLATFGAPKAGSLTSAAPAGLTAGSGARVSGNPAIASTALTAPGIRASTVVNPAAGTTTTTTTDATSTSMTTTSILNSAVVDSAVTATDGVTPVPPGTVAANVSRGPAQSVSMGSSGLNPVEVARAFLQADANRDGQLSRAEAQRLPPSFLTFEEMDRNFDGVITRFEYEDGMR